MRPAQQRFICRGHQPDDDKTLAEMKSDYNWSEVSSFATTESQHPTVPEGSPARVYLVPARFALLFCLLYSAILSV